MTSFAWKDRPPAQLPKRGMPRAWRIATVIASCAALIATIVIVKPDTIRVLDAAYSTWIGVALLLIVVLIAHEFLSGKTRPMSVRTAGVIAGGSLLWPLLLVEIAWRWMRADPA